MKGSYPEGVACDSDVRWESTGFQSEMGRQSADMPVDLIDEGGVLGDLSGERMDIADDAGVLLNQPDDVALGLPDPLLLHVDLVEQRGEGVLGPVGRRGDEKSDEQLGHGGDQIQRQVEAGDGEPSREPIPAREPRAPESEESVHARMRTNQNSMLSGRPIASDTQSAKRSNASGA